MPSPKIHVIMEGATEREVGKVLREQGILSQRAEPEPPDWTSHFGKSREGYEQVIGTMQKQGTLDTLRDSSQQEQLLLLFDLEDVQLPQERADDIARKLRLSFHPVSGFDNLFEDCSPELHIILHVSNAPVAGINRYDFDGYILQLLQGPKKKEIAKALLGDKVKDDPDLPDKLLLKAEQEITGLMKSNGYPWTHAKSWLYAYITAFQFRQSHVWFAAKVVEKAPRDEVKKVLASLIHAWDILAQGGDQ